MRSPVAASSFEVARDLAELGDAHLAEVGDLEVVPLAGGFELLLLLEFGDGRAAAHRWGRVGGVGGCGSADRAGRGRVRAYGKGHLRVDGGTGRMVRAESLPQRGCRSG